MVSRHQHLVEDWHKWAFLQDWAQMSIEAKNEKYNEFAGHELNLFAFFNDPSYFDKFIEPFLRNKLSKSLVDHYLLQQEEALLGYLEPARLGQL